MTRFSDLNLGPKALQAIEDAGYETPTPIQVGAIPPALEGRDVLGIAQTGTGKTAAFVLPMITILSKGRARARMPRSLVLEPTRELAAQVAENFDIYAKHTKFTKALLIGGVSFGEQDKLIDRGVDVLIATPGRLLDHFGRGKLLLTGVQIMVVDEADRMLDMGFIPDIERIFAMTPFTRQTLFFSATMPPEIERITNTFLSNPTKIEVARQATASETITQALVELHPVRRDRAATEKRDLLRALIASEGAACTNAIVFCNRKRDVDVVAKSLKAHGLNAEAIHGDLVQSMRTRVLNGFRDGQIDFLVASDVAARGLDIPDVSHIFNFDVPTHAEDYIHRIGRTGRAGRAGKAFTLALPADDKYVAAIEHLIRNEIPRVAPPIDATSAKAKRAGTKAAGHKSPRSGQNASVPRQDAAPKEAMIEPSAPQTPAGKAARPEAVSSSRRSTSKAESGQSRQAGSKKASSTKSADRSGGKKNERVVGMGDHVPAFLTRSFAKQDG